MNNILYKIVEKWYLFIAWLIISCILCITAVDLAIKPKDEETISIFIGAYSVDINGLKNDLTENLYPFIYNLTGRKPIILPVIMEVNRKEVSDKVNEDNKILNNNGKNNDKKNS